MISKRAVVVLCIVGSSLVSAQARAQAAPAQPAQTQAQVEPQPSVGVQTLSPKLVCLQVMANTTVLKTDAGLVVVDAGLPNEAARLAAKIAELGSPVVYLVDTHYHDDHTGGNAVVGKNATIVAQQAAKESMLRNLKAGQTPEAAGVPKETYATERELRVGQDTVKLLHLGHGHTAGDTVVVFEAEKVIAAGDLYFNGVAPYIDVADGSDTGAWVKTIATLAARYPGYKVVPGHGPVSDIAGWQRFAEYLTAVRRKVAAAIEAGQTREQAVASIKLDEFPEVKPMGDFLGKDKNVGWVYDEMKRVH